MTSSCPISARPWALALVAIIVIGSLTAYAYTTTQASLITNARAGLESTAAVMATQVNASDIEGLQPGDENSLRYKAVVEKLRNLRSMDDTILNAYILKVNPDHTVTFLVDDLTFSDPTGSAMIGEVSTDPNKEEIFAALSVPTSSNGPYTTKYGSFMSAYAPIDDAAGGSNGNTVAVLAIDIPAKTYTDAVNASGGGILILGLAATLIVLALVFRCSPAAGDKKKE
jgi:hypothetical protein